MGEGNSQDRPVSEGFADDEWALRQEIVTRCRELNERGINQGMSGNISARCGDGFLISPSGFPYERMQPEHIVPMRFDASWEGKLRPSSEWRFHLDILQSREDVHAVIHAHPMYCTTLAIMGLDIPPLHYMIAVTGGDSIRCAPYATFGTEELSKNALEALHGRQACLLANHGVIVTGGNLGGAMWLLVEVETLAQQYVNTLQLGGPRLLDEQQLAEVRKAMFAGYAKPDRVRKGQGDAQAKKAK
jgi:L-fuculose-phosphate aldolase